MGTIRALSAPGFDASGTIVSRRGDADAARERGIPVVNVPAYGTAAVGQ